MYVLRAVITLALVACAATQDASCALWNNNAVRCRRSACADNVTPCFYTGAACVCSDNCRSNSGAGNNAKCVAAKCNDGVTACTFNAGVCSCATTDACAAVPLGQCANRKCNNGQTSCVVHGGTTCQCPHDCGSIAGNDPRSCASQSCFNNRNPPKPVPCRMVNLGDGPYCGCPQCPVGGRKRQAGSEVPGSPAEYCSDSGFQCGETNDCNINCGTCLSGFCDGSDNMCDCVSVCQDPHFKGLDGNRYEFQGEANKVFALISDSSIELNSNFVPGKRLPGHDRHAFTYLGATCLRTCGHRVIMFPNRTVTVDGNDVQLRGTMMTSNLEINYRAYGLVEVLVPGRWELAVAMTGDRVDVNYAKALYKYDGKTHGILGHTLGNDPEKVKAKCNTYEEGLCEVEGDYHSYEVDQLCGSNFAHSFFSEANCA